VGSSRPVNQRHWPVSPAKEKVMFSEIENMLAMVVYEESRSQWSSNCVLVQRGEKIRLCLDSREVNKLPLKDAYPLPQVDGILSRLHPARYITGLDMKHAFWQIPLVSPVHSFQHTKSATIPVQGNALRLMQRRSNTL